MSASRVHPDAGWPVHSHAYWLPLGGTGNGLDAAAWAPIADTSELTALRMLTALATEGVAAYTAPRDGHRPRLRPHGRPPVYGIWVDSRLYSVAEETLRKLGHGGGLS